VEALLGSLRTSYFDEAPKVSLTSFATFDRTELFIVPFYVLVRGLACSRSSRQRNLQVIY
jgi:hypothetical protein